MKAIVYCVIFLTSSWKTATNYTREPHDAHCTPDTGNSEEFKASFCWWSLKIHYNPSIQATVWKTLISDSEH